MAGGAPFSMNIKDEKYSQETGRDDLLNAQNKTVNAILKEKGLNRRSYWEMKMREIFERAVVVGGQGRTGRMFKGSVLEEMPTRIVSGGHMVEVERQMMEALRMELEQTKKEVEVTWNQLVELDEAITPTLVSMIERVRAKRMAMLSELREILSVSKEVREFFLNKEQEAQMRKMDDFIKACRAFKQLKDDGVLDVMIDAVLKLNG